MQTLGRVVRPHFAGAGEQLLVDDLSLLRARERRELPEPTRRLFETWRQITVPYELAWARDLFRCLYPVLERVRFDERVYWTVRLVRYPAENMLSRPCFGADGIPLARAALPAPLDWLARTLGTVSVVVEQSGTAPWGEPLSARRTFYADDYQPELAKGSDAWVALYEADGDAVYADLASGAAYWIGGEWTGEPETALAVSWRAATQFVLWRMLDGGWVRPMDLEMIAAARRV